MSFQVIVGSNCFDTQAASDVTPSMPVTWPARLPNVLRFPRRMLHAHAGLVAMSSTLASVSSGGTVIPFLTSQ